MPNPACDDRRVHLGLPRHLQDRHWTGILQDAAAAPYLGGYQGILGQMVRLLFQGVCPLRLDSPKTVVVDKARILATVAHMRANVAKLVQQGEPEVVYPVIPQSEPYHRPTVRQRQGRAVQVRPRYVRHVLQGHPVLTKEISGLYRAVPQSAHTRQLSHELGSDGVGVVLHGRIVLPGLGQLLASTTPGGRNRQSWR